MGGQLGGWCLLGLHSLGGRYLGEECSEVEAAHDQAHVPIVPCSEVEYHPIPRAQYASCHPGST